VEYVQQDQDQDAHLRIQCVEQHAQAYQQTVSTVGSAEENAHQTQLVQEDIAIVVQAFQYAATNAQTN